MSKKLLKKLSSILASADQTAAVEPAREARLNAVLLDHLDVIAAAHSSNHGSHHGSTP